MNRPHNKRLANTHANCRKYCRLVGSAFIHFANPNRRSAVTQEATPITRYCPDAKSATSLAMPHINCKG